MHETWQSWLPVMQWVLAEVCTLSVQSSLFFIYLKSYPGFKYGFPD